MPIGFHEARHSYVSLMHTAGIPLNALATVWGRILEDLRIGAH